MITIWRLKRLSRRLREKRGLPPISKEDEDDQLDPENDPNFVPVLSEKQQAQLRYQQEKFKASQVSLSSFAFFWRGVRRGGMTD